VTTPSGANRYYSLSNDPGERDRYVIAVKRDAAGRGGSISMTDELGEGDMITVTAPLNEFALNERARSFVFVAGGIGITPVLSMMRYLSSTDGPRFKLVYLTREPADTAFLDQLRGEEWGSRVTIHHDHGDRGNAFDLWTLFEKPASGAHVYCCGPRPLMDSVRDMTGHWPQGSSKSCATTAFGRRVLARAVRAARAARHCARARPSIATWSSRRTKKPVRS
jgi:phthalate 4,5-dioxygenase reductase subunit